MVARTVHPDGQLDVILATSGGAKGVIVYDPATATTMGGQPLVRDNYEETMVELGQSGVPGAGQGLFSRRDVARGTLVSFINGHKVPADVNYMRDIYGIDNVGSIAYDSVHGARKCGIPAL